MTSLGKCDICHKNDAIGVASTSIPYSCAMCMDCARRGADPELVFIHLYENVAHGDPSKIREGLTTYKDDKYMSFHEWAKTYAPQKRTD